MNINVIKKPWVTERATALAAIGQYVFLVDDKATKNEIKKAVKALYQVDAVSVNTVNRPAKMKRFGARKTLTGNYRKAIVTLKKGQKIEIA